jgi:hypothetical protein
MGEGIKGRGEEKRGTFGWTLGRVDSEDVQRERAFALISSARNSTGEWRIADMKLKNRVIMVVTVLTLSLALSAPAALAADQLVVVATKATYQAAQPWVDFLTSKGIPLQNVEPAQFKEFKQSPYVVVMGGVDEAGVKDLVKEAVGEQELAALGKAGVGKMYLRSGIWAPGQNVVVFAGSDSKAAETARKEARDQWTELFAEWFGIELGGRALGGY